MKINTEAKNIALYAQLDQRARLIPITWLVTALYVIIGYFEWRYGSAVLASIHGVGIACSFTITLLLYSQRISSGIAVFIYMSLVFVLVSYDYQFDSVTHGLVFYSALPFLMYYMIGIGWGSLYCGLLLMLELGLYQLSANGLIVTAYEADEISFYLILLVFFAGCAYFIERGRQHSFDDALHQRDQFKAAKLELDQQLKQASRLERLDGVLLQPSYEQALSGAVDVLLESLACSRAWILHVRADNDTWHVPFEQTWPEYPGALKAGDFVAMDDGSRSVFEAVQQQHKPVIWDNMQDIPGDKAWVKRYHIYSQMMGALNVEGKDQWFLGIHQCDHEKHWPEHEQDYFSECAQRIQAVLSQSILHDDLKKAVQKSNQSSDAKSTFLATMSHELRTPLHGIIGMQSLLAKRADYLKDEDQKLLNLAQHSSHILSSLIDDVLDLSKIEAGKVDIEMAEFDLLACLQDAFFPFLMAAFEKKIRLDLNYTMIPERIIGDEKRIRHVLLNVLGNAVKFTDQGGVTLSVRYQAQHLQMRVIDTGIGMAEDKLNMIFEPFVQLTNDAERKGTGLGTTIAHQFVNMMYGHIDVRSEEGKGSTFIIELPLTAVGPARASDQIELNQLKIKLQGGEVVDDAPALANLRVLLAEDDPIARMIALENLSDHALDVDVAEHGLQAWEKYQANDYDLLLTDIRMPGLNGIELTRRIRQSEKEKAKQEPDFPPLCIIGISAHVLEDVAQECLAQGMNDFISKPINPDALMQRLRQMNVVR